MANLSLNNIFVKRKLEEIPKPPNGLIALDPNTTLARAAEILSENHIQSAPVSRITSAESSSEFQFPAVLDMINVMSFIVKHAKTTSAPLGGFLDFAKEMEVFEKVTVQQVLQPSPNNMIPLTGASTLLDAMLLMGHYNVRRIPVVDPTGQVENYITQMGVVKEIAAMCDRGDFSLDVPLEAAGLATGNVLSVRENSPFLDAFTVMDERAISGVPVVNEEGVVIANISASDAHFVARYPILFEMITRSHLTVSQYLETLRECGEQVRDPITVGPTSSIKEVVGIMLNARIHRVYVVDDKKRPIGVVSLGNIIKVLVEVPDQFFEKFVLGL